MARERNAKDPVRVEADPFPACDCPPVGGGPSDALRARIAPSLVHVSPEPVLSILLRWDVLSLEQLSRMSPTRCGKAIDAIPVGDGTWEGQLCDLRSINEELWHKREKSQRSRDVTCLESDALPRAGGASEAMQARLRVDGPSEPVVSILEKWNIRCVKQLSWWSPERCHTAINTLPADVPDAFQYEGQLCNLRALNSELWQERLERPRDANVSYVSWFGSDALPPEGGPSEALRSILRLSVRGSPEVVMQILAAWNIRTVTQLSWMSPERCGKGIDVLPTNILGSCGHEGELCDLRMLNVELCRDRIEQN
jgi:hypothetical protein